MIKSLRLLEETLAEKLANIGGVEPEEAEDIAFAVVEALEEDGFFDDDGDDSY